LKDLQTVEGANEYSNVILVFRDHRVIVCRDAIQWVIQKKRKSRSPTAQWRGLSYCRTKKALIRLWTSLYPEIDPVRMSVLDRLPDWCDG
jgi:ribosomal protein L15E